MEEEKQALCTQQNIEKENCSQWTGENVIRKRANKQKKG